MKKLDINFLKKQIIYRCSYTGLKETDLLYKNIFLKNLHNFNDSDLYQIFKIFDTFSDLEIYSFLSGKNIPPVKFKKLFDKLINA